MSHEDLVTHPPKGFRATASTPTSAVAVMEDSRRKLYGVQFHPEVIHTPYGMRILKNFLYNICDCSPTWTMVSIIEQEIDRIRKTAGKAKIICGLSGGVDSATAAVLVHKAVGDQLTCIFVDHGLLRKGEAEQVEETFRKHFRVNLVCVDAQERFLKKLKGVVDPEQKRVLIGREFIKVFEKAASKIKGVKFLVQGTLYPDVIESGVSKEAAKIKTHHNVGALPAKMDFELVEPLRLLFKDEVRAVAEELGLPEEVVWRHPFPGPGLAIRIIGEVTSERLKILREAVAIVEEEIKRAGLYRKLWQAFAILPAIKSVGVMGDQRTYAYPIVVRAVTSQDAMTADWAKIPHRVLEHISNRIINEVAGVNRVVYDISSKPPSTIEWE
jgi:GMP synthase (glutamine-hydrolysing)